MAMKKIIFITFLALAVFLGGCASPQAEDVIGEVNGDNITRAEYDLQYNMLKLNYENEKSQKLDVKKDKEIIRQLGDQAFNELVLQGILKQEADKKKIKVSQEEIDADLNYIKEMQSQDNDKGFEEFLSKMGLNEKQLREQIETQLIYWKLYGEITPDVKVDEKEIKEFYDKNIQTYKEPAGIEISHILVNNEKDAKNIITQLNKDEDFAELAAEHSICPSKEKGGDLGIVNESSGLVKEFKDAALKLKPGEITKNPVKTEFGYHIIKAGQEQEEKTRSFEEVKNEIRLKLQQEKSYELFNSYLEDLHKSAKIKDNRK